MRASVWLSQLVFGAGLSILAFSCTPRSPDDDADEPPRDLNAGEEVLTDTALAGLPKGMGGTNGDSDFCNNPAQLCVATGPDNEGDCDSDAQCSGGNDPQCGKDNGLKFGFPPDWDVCWQGHCENGVMDGDEVGGVNCGGSCGACGACGGMNGDANFCTTGCQCDAGEGDCDQDTQCTAGNICGVNNGPAFGMPATYDVCWPATCENRMMDNGETGIDCGGPCVVACAAGGTIFISEIFPRPSTSQDREWIELYNPFGSPIDISGWSLNDYITAESTVRWRFPAGTSIAARDAIIVARYNDQFSPTFGMNADFEMATGTRNDPNVPNMVAVGGNTHIIMSDVAGGDAVILRDPAGALVTGVEYGTVDRVVPGAMPALRPPVDASLTRTANGETSAASYTVDTTASPGVHPNP